MKKMLLSLLPALLVFAFTSCTKEAADEKEDKQPVESYLPLTTGTYWVYRDSAQRAEIKMTMTNDKFVIQNHTLRAAHFFNPSSNKNDSVYFGKIDHDYFVAGLVNEPNKNAQIAFHFLNDEKAAGQSWEYDGGQSNGMIAHFKTTIIEKGITKTVAGKTYDNVIHSQMELTYNSMGQTIPAGLYQIYTAKGVGIIRTESTVGFLGLATYRTTSDLIEYHIE